MISNAKQTDLVQRIFSELGFGTVDPDALPTKLDALRDHAKRLQTLAVDQFRQLCPDDQKRTLSAIHDGEVPFSPDFVWLCLCQSGLAALAVEVVETRHLS